MPRPGGDVRGPRFPVWHLAAAVLVPLHEALQPESAGELARFGERTEFPAESHNRADAQPVAPAHPAIAPVYTLRRGGDVRRPRFSAWHLAAAVLLPLGDALQPESASELARFGERTEFPEASRNRAGAQPVAPVYPPIVPVGVIGPRRHAVRSPAQVLHLALAVEVPLTNALQAEPSRESAGFPEWPCLSSARRLSTGSEPVTPAQPAIAPVCLVRRGRDVPRQGPPVWQLAPAVLVPLGHVPQLEAANEPSSRRVTPDRLLISEFSRGNQPIPPALPPQPFVHLVGRERQVRGKGGPGAAQRHAAILVPLRLAAQAQGPGAFARGRKRQVRLAADNDRRRAQPVRPGVPTRATIHGIRTGRNVVRPHVLVRKLPKAIAPPFVDIAQLECPHQFPGFRKPTPSRRD